MSPKITRCDSIQTKFVDRSKVYIKIVRRNTFSSTKSKLKIGSLITSAFLVAVIARLT